jgi:putative ABC transport system permease protein
MTVIRWAGRTLVRAPLRTLLLIGVLSVSIGLALIMITVNGAFSDRLDEIRGQVGTTVTVRPAGTFGGGFVIGSSSSDDAEGGSLAPGGAPAPQQQPQQTLTDDDLAPLSEIDHISAYSRKITAQYTGDALESSIEPPAGFEPPPGVEVIGPPITVTGTDDSASLTAFGEDAEIVDGRTFDSDDGEANVAVIGQSLAETNGLAVGDAVDLQGTTVEVIGVFSTGTQFGDNSIALPLETARSIFDRGNEVDEVSVHADSAANVTTVQEAIREALGEDKADVTTDEGQFAAISSPISDAQSSSEVATIAALIATAIIILFSVGIVIRQRVKEIGILKAVGASGWQVTGQMTIETLIIAVTAAVIGAVATFPLAQKVADGLVSNPAPTQQLIGGPGGGPPPGAVGGVAVLADGPADSTEGVLGAVQVAVSPEVFAYALAIAVALALIAAIIPTWYVGRVRPAEVLRYE